MLLSDVWHVRPACLIMRHCDQIMLLVMGPLEGWLAIAVAESSDFGVFWWHPDCMLAVCQ